MSKTLISVIILIILGVFGLFALYQKSDTTSKVALIVPTSTPNSVNISANFDIYTHGTKRIFTSPKYHNLSSAVFINSDSPNTVYVKESGITWADFFKTLPMQLTKDCLITGTQQTFCTGEGGNLKFYINDQEDVYALDRVIKDGDSLVVKYEK